MYRKGTSFRLREGELKYASIFFTRDVSAVEGGGGVTKNPISRRRQKRRPGPVKRKAERLPSKPA